MGELMDTPEMHHERPEELLRHCSLVDEIDAERHCAKNIRRRHGKDGHNAERLYPIDETSHQTLVPEKACETPDPI